MPMTRPSLYPEKKFQREIITHAQDNGWLVFSNGASRQNRTPGFPDLCMVHEQDVRLVFAELKSDTGVLKPMQKRWLEVLRQEPQPEAFAWWPSDKDEAERVLLSFRNKVMRGLP